MPLSLAFSDRAEQDLIEIALFIAADHPQRALSFVEDLRAFCLGLREYPARHRLREEYGRGVRVAVHGRYLIFYAERDAMLVIERILHGSRHRDGLGSDRCALLPLRRWRLEKPLGAHRDTAARWICQGDLPKGTSQVSFEASFVTLWFRVG